MRIGKNLLLVLAAATVLLTACNNEDLVEKSYSSHTITATMAEASSDSRTSIEGLQVIWNENDAISVFAGEGQNFQGVLTTGSGTKKADFQLVGYASETKHVALYPYLKDASYDGNTISLNVPSTYVYEKNNIGGSTMAALIGDDSEIAFKNAGALMGLTVMNIPAGYNQAILKSTVEGQPLAGNCIITFDVDGVPTIQSSTAEGAATENEITIEFEAEEGATKTFYFPIPVAKYTSLEFSISNGSAPIVLKTKGLDAKRNKRYQTAIILGENGAVPVAVSGAGVSQALAEGATSLVISVNNSDDANITLPASDKNLMLTFEPTDEMITLNGVEGTSTNVTIAAALGAKFDIDLPTTTVTLSANGESTNYETVTARTAENTLIVGEGVTVKDLKVAGGNVQIHGKVEKLSRTFENVDIVTWVDKQGEGTLGTLVGDKTKFFVEIDNTYEIGTLAAFKYFAKDVDNGNTYEGKTVVLTDSIDLNLGTEDDGDPICFKPIGSYRFKKIFMGTFDGQGYTIKNLSQNTWALDNGYYYTDCGLGLFGYLKNATIRNLKIDKASISGESALCGIVAAAAYGNMTFEDITITNSQCADYQYYAGGIVGWASGNHKYIGCNVEASTTVATQWGDFDNSTGGVIGGAGGSATIFMKDCNIACRIDAHNDVVSSYQWYAYRRCGMLIGNTSKTKDINGTNYADAPQLTCENVTVTYGDWAYYTYCAFAGTSWPYVRVQAGISCSAYSNVRYGHPKDANGNEVVDDNHVHNEGEDHHLLLQFDQLYGGATGVYGTKTHDGVTVKYPNTISGTTPSN